MEVGGQMDKSHGLLDNCILYIQIYLLLNQKLQETYLMAKTRERKWGFFYSNAN